MQTHLTLFSVGLILLVIPHQSEAQTYQDTLALYSAVLFSRLGPEPAGPDGPVQVVCEIGSSEGFGLTTSPFTGEPLLVDTLPDLTPRLRQLVSEVLSSEYGLPLVGNCDRWRDADGRQGVSIGVSGPLFVGDAEATLYASASMGGVWGSGARCTWRREDATGGWTREGCTGGWISDRAAKPSEASTFLLDLGSMD